jgi:uncharacterized protein
MDARLTRLIIPAAVLVVLFGVIAILVRIFPDILWFNMVGYIAVYWKILQWQIILGVLVGGLFLVVAMVNLYLLYRFTPSRLSPTLVEAIPIGGEIDFDLRKSIYTGLALLAVGFSLIMGYSATARWEHLLRYFNSKDLAFQSATPLVSGVEQGTTEVVVPELDVKAKALSARDAITIKEGNQQHSATIESINLSGNGQTQIRFSPPLQFNVTQKAVLVAPARDPIFRKNVSYYIFKMPIERFICGSLFGLFLLLTLFSGVLYFFHGSLVDDRNRFNPPTRVKAHLLTLGGLTLLFRAWNYRFAMYDLLYTVTDMVRGGGGYAAIRARLPLLQILLILTILCALVFIISIFLRQIRYAVGGFVIFLLVGMVGQVYPAFVQKWRVEPNKQELEAEYINYNIKATLHAYDLEDGTVTEEEYPLMGKLSYNGITNQENASVIKSIRLWDWRPLRRTFRQLQELRSQYDFPDVDIDRYPMENGDPRQVMLSGRELNIDDLPREVRNDWFKRTYVYTHGYGAVLSPVNEVDDSGKPEMYIKNIDPIYYNPEWKYRFDDNPGPRIYYGERTNHYVIVHPNRSEGLEFDYPETFGQDFAKYSYKGKGGVELSTFWRKFVYMLKFNNELKFVLPGEIMSDSRVLYHRNISDRVKKIAPFLRYDRDPYLVIHNGRLIWMIDAYTVTSLYPYSAAMQDVLRAEIAARQGQRAASRVVGSEKSWEKNYIRNAVKVTVDAYDGTVQFYIIEQEKDPIAECYSRMFPELFKPFDTLPEDFKSHIRYPVTMFLIQARIYQDYHMKDPITFYASEDQWEIGKELYDNTERPRTQSTSMPTSPFAPRQPVLPATVSNEQEVQPYYVVIRQPGEVRAEFMLMLPFTPKNKPNLTAWLAARCDLPQYGQLLVYRFPKGKLAPGPMQVENFISQEPNISQQISLWNTQGSRVLRGNLLIIPMGNSILYVEPIYIQSEDEKTAIPELRRVVIGYGEKVVWGASFDKALRQMFPAIGGQMVGTQQPSGSETTIDATPVETLSANQTPILNLVQQANRYFEQAQSAQRTGDWAEYGRYQNLLKETLKQLAANAQ